MSAVQGLGYEATLMDDDSLAAGMEERQREKRFWAIKFGVACVFSVPVFLLSMVFMYIPGVKQGLDSNLGGFTWGEVFKWALTTPVQVQQPVTYSGRFRMKPHILDLECESITRRNGVCVVTYAS